MLIKYYKNGLMAYATRKRYLDISNFNPFNEEEQSAVKLGDGVDTTLKTSVENICDYVTIDNTRWFVASYYYLNGKQVVLKLRRDVVGEFGLGNAYGKVIRGYTDGILKYRKELSLNQILKKRVPLKSAYDKYGNITVSTHENEMWGVLYFTKDSTQENISIPIPAFSPSYESYGAPDLSQFYRTSNVTQYTYQTFVIKINIKTTSPGNPLGSTKTQYFYTRISYKYDGNKVSSSIECSRTGSTSNSIEATINVLGFSEDDTASDSMFELAANKIGEYLANLTINGTSGFSFPTTEIFSYVLTDNYANGKNYEENGFLYKYTSVTDSSKSNVYGSTNNSAFLFEIANKTFSYNDPALKYTYAASISGVDINGQFVSSSRYNANVIKYSRTQLSSEEAGTLILDMKQQLVDEPYCCLVVPLYDVTIENEKNGETYNIKGQSAFNAFNEVILYLSGENGRLVDAQIYPYCPRVFDKQTSVGANTSDEIPFFSIQSTFFETECLVNPNPYMDVKKEYIKRNYSIVSPDQSSKFTFNFYDYVNEFAPILGEEDKNGYPLVITIKTALKPFAIISSAVITRVADDNGVCLMGINYPSNIQGSQPSSNGFECSLSSNAFETYKRQNSNYQAIFEVDRTELSINHETERVNEAVQGTMNTLAATMFGAVAGKSMADTEILGTNVTGAIGAGVGAATALVSTAAANAAQYVQNEKLRSYEKEFQQKRFDLTIGTIKNIPNSINRISSFNEIIMKDFYYVLEIYECTELESSIVDDFIDKYSYSIGVYDYFSNYQKDGWFFKAETITSELQINLHNAFETDIAGGVYIYGSN